MPKKPQRGTPLRTRLWVKVVLVVFGLWLLSAIWLLGTAWYSVAGYEPRSVPDQVALILTPQAYALRIDTHPRPYVYEFESPGAGRVVVFGCQHTKQPDDPQLDMVQARWNALDPTLALIEGNLGMMFPAFMDPVRTFAETGFVHALSRADSVPTRSWEPPDATVIQGVLDQGFSPEQVALRWILTPYFSNLRFGRPENPESFVSDTLRERTRTEGIAGTLTTLTDVDTAWARAFPQGPDWREVSDEYGLPGFLGEMDFNQPRDVHLVACIAELVREGERVFVIAGTSHAVKIEPALAAIFE